MHKETGKTQTLNCNLDPARAQSLHHSLARIGAPPKTGDALPPFWHQIYFWDTRPPAELGRDGHPKTGSFIPDLGLPRRMWAGGDLAFAHPVRIGAPAVKTTTLESVTEKTGRTGPLAFVTLRHDIHQNGTLCMTENQHLVYRQDPTQPQTTPLTKQARTDETNAQTNSFNSTLLFRYSALTNNGHRIHYDLDYATQIEGYTGLVVHGPLLAQLLMDLAQRHLGPLRKFSFRAVSPLMHTESASFCIKDSELWVRAPDGRLCMEATAN